MRSNPAGLEKFGGAHRVTNLPADLQIVQIGKDPEHFEIIPVKPMTFDEYQDLLNQIVLVLV